MVFYLICPAVSVYQIMTPPYKPRIVKSAGRASAPHDLIPFSKSLSKKEKKTNKQKTDQRKYFPQNSYLKPKLQPVTRSELESSHSGVTHTRGAARLGTAASCAADEPDEKLSPGRL